MAANSYKNLRSNPAWGQLVLLAVLTAVGLLSFAALMLPLSGDDSFTMEVGDVAPIDIRAPTAINYQSQVLTDQRRAIAVNAVSPIYSPPDARIARVQLERLRAVLSFIDNVRADQYASIEQKRDDLAALKDIELRQETVDSILSLSQPRWEAVRQESIVVLEQVMRSTIRENQAEDARRSVPALVSLAMPEDQAAITAELVSAFVVPNSLFDEQLTEAAREQASEAVSPVTRSFATGETIVERGQIVTATDLEALQRFGLLEPESRWQDVASASALVLLMVGFGALYLRYQPALLQDLRSLTLFAVLFTIFLFGARLTIPGRTVIPYLYPLPAFGLVLSALFGVQYGLILSLPLSVLISFGLPNALDLTLYYFLGSVFGVLVLGRAQRLSMFIGAGIAVAVTGVGIVLVYRLPDPTADLIGMLTLTGAAVFNGIASASLAVLLQFLLAQVLGLTTALQLLELSRPDFPLLQFILRNAAGTYQHSLQVANLAEQAAERIGADPLLTRVGALYHDAGKALNPFFFIENQLPGFTNPHDALSPQESAAIIIRHVPDGLELAKKYRLPHRLLDFVAEHHGTMLTRYQYVKALNAAGGDAGQVDKEHFSYPGPKPQSRETALVMIADGCESKVRADRPGSEEELRELVKGIIDSRLADGQLDDTELTTKDLNLILESFTSTLRRVFHPRIEYPPTDRLTVPRGEQIQASDSASAQDSMAPADRTTQAP